MTPKTMKQYIDEHIAMSDECLAEHVILSRGPGEQLRIGRPDRSEYLCTLFLAQRHLVLVGDLDTMVWGGCPYPKIEQAISWMSTRDVGHYVLQKAKIGMGHVGCESYVPEVALQAALGRLLESAENDLRWSDVANFIQETEHDGRSLDDMIYDTFSDCELLGIGMCPSQRLLWAWSIVRKANELLTTGKDAP